MRIRNLQQANAAVLKSAAMVLCGLIILITSGCEEPKDSDGLDFNKIVLPTDLLLNLSCENVGIFNETCILQDPANPFRFVATFEFDVNNPTGPSKYDLFEDIPTGPAGAKARFYLFATALARRQSGENQWYTARALHELYTYNEDDLIRRQALRAYRSLFDNMFGSVVFFNVFGFDIPFTLNEQGACDIYRPPSGYDEIVLAEDGGPGGDLDKLKLIGGWGYTFKPGTGPSCDGALLTVNAG